MRYMKIKPMNEGCRVGDTFTIADTRPLWLKLWHWIIGETRYLTYVIVYIDGDDVSAAPQSSIVGFHAGGNDGR